MSRATIAANRIVAFLVGLVLIGVGVAGVLWWQGTLTRWFPGVSDRLDTSAVTDLTRQPWWPWAAGAAGVVLVLLGLCWLLGHLPSRSVSQLKLPGSTSSGKLAAQVRPVAAAAAEALGQTPGVRSAKGSIREERGQLVARLNATVEQQADLAAVANAAERVSAQLGQVMQRDDLVCQVNLTVARRDRTPTRVS